MASSVMEVISTQPPYLPISILDAKQTSAAIVKFLENIQQHLAEVSRLSREART